MKPFGLLVLAGLSLSACADDLPEEPSIGEFRELEDGLELHWSFEDRVGSQITDLSGHGRHGTLHGGSFVSSPLGEALSLDGVDDYVALTHAGLRAPSLYGGVSGNFTISARVRVDDVNKLNTLCFGCGPFSTMHVGTVTYPAKVMSALFNQTTNGSIYPRTTADLVNDEWREVTLVVDGGVSARYYLDCVADTQVNNTSIGLKDYNFSAVGYGSSADRWYGGEIDQLRVWSRALSETELAELCPEPPVEDGPLLHWTFEDHSGTQITDLSGNGYHGTLNGGAFVSSPKGEAISLDGVDDSVAFTGPRSPALYGGVNGDFTISARVRVADIDKHNTLCVGCGPFATWYLGDTALGGRISASFLNQSTNGTLWANSTPAISEDEWTEVTMVVDGGTSVRHYFNCGFDAQVSNTNIGLKDTNFSALGSSANAARWFGGEIDELRIWDRALPEQELAQLCDCLGPIHVDVDAADGGDGESWATAFNDLQAALDAGLACDSPEIWVAEGTYAPGAVQDPVATITAPVSIYGGFAGTETSRAQRDFVAHPVRIGGDFWHTAIVVTDTAIELGKRVHLDGFSIIDARGGAIKLEDAAIDTPDPLVSLHNLVLEDNSASKGAGVYSEGSFGIEVVGCRFEGNTRSVTSGCHGAAIYAPGGELYIDDSSFIDNDCSQAAINTRDIWDPDVGAVHISNSVMSGNIGGGIIAGEVTAENTEFSNNSAIGHGGAISIAVGRLEVHDCTFTGNQAKDGGAIALGHAADPDGTVSSVITNSTFTSNSAEAGGAIDYQGGDDHSLSIESSEFVTNAATKFIGGAIVFWGNDPQLSLTLTDVSFVGNTSAGHSGAVGIEGGIASIVGSTFVDNSANYAGAMQLSEGSVEIRDSRFVSNEATVSTGGALRILTTDVEVINTEFVGNSSTLHGGGVYGRATFEGCTFANNSAGGSGKGLFAPAGAAMTIRNVVAWPDNLAAGSMILDHSCIPQVAGTNNGTVFIVADPFAPADLDMDGLTEFYLAPSSACVDVGGTVSEFDWSVLTTQASQCTDSSPVDAGVHYTPQSANGPC